MYKAVNSKPLIGSKWMNNEAIRGSKLNNGFERTYNSKYTLHTIIHHTTVLIASLRISAGSKYPLTDIIITYFNYLLDYVNPHC